MNDLEGMAQAAWESYYAEYKKRYGAVPPRIGNAPRTTPVYKAFYRIASKCDKAEIDVRDYIVFCFSKVVKQRMYITPNDFTSDKLIAGYKDFLTRIGATAQPQLEYARQLQKLDGYKLTSAYPDTHSILNCMGTAFYPWFRIFYFNEYPNDISNIWGTLAYEELRSNRSLRDFLRKIRPGSMQLFEQLFGVFGD